MPSPPEELAPGEARIFLIGAVGYPVGLLYHAVFAITFWILDLPVLALFNVGSVIVWSIGLWVHFRGRMIWSAVVCIMIEAPLHAVLVTVYVGIETGFFLHLFAGIFVVLIMPFFQRWQRWLVGAVIGLSIAVVGSINVAIGPISPQPVELSAAFFGLNALGFLVLTLCLLGVYEWSLEKAETALQQEYERSERLLDNILPSKIAAQLKDSESSIANEFSDVTVLFADIVGFTDTAAALEPTELIDLLNDVFSDFDDLVTREGVEKIKTIGDAYMAVAGLPEPRADHATVIAGIALDMMEVASRHSGPDGKPLQIRIGLNSGPVVAGVIGHKKFAYDLWGDAVNVAARMEAHGKPGRIQISATTQSLVADRFTTEERGMVDIKSKGPMATHYLTGRRPPAHGSRDEAVAEPT